MLRDYSRTIAGKEQLLIGALAKALEIIPRQLCDNAGFDATNILNKLRQKHAQGEIISTIFDYLSCSLCVIVVQKLKIVWCINEYSFLLFTLYCFVNSLICFSISSFRLSMVWSGHSQRTHCGQL